jgi:hypothetical protein
MAKTLYADAGTYVDANVAALTSSEPSLTFKNATAAADNASTGPKVVSVDATSATTWYAAVKSDTGTCYYIKDSVDLASAPSAGTTYFKDTGAATCVADDGVAYAADGWK